MKKISFFAAILITLNIGPVQSATLNADAAAKLMTKSGCGTCHTIDKDKIGPAYKFVAARYANPSPETLAYLKGEKPIDYLMKKVRTGTKPALNKNWLKNAAGKPYGLMTPNPVGKIKDEDLKDLLTYILSLK